MQRRDLKEEFGWRLGSPDRTGRPGKNHQDRTRERAYGRVQGRRRRAGAAGEGQNQTQEQDPLRRMSETGPQGEIPEGRTRRGRTQTGAYGPVQRGRPGAGTKGQTQDEAEVPQLGPGTRTRQGWTVDVICHPVPVCGGGAEEYQFKSELSSILRASCNIIIGKQAGFPVYQKPKGF